MDKLSDITGQKFGRLTALGIDATKGNPLSWMCVCDCGTPHAV